MASAYIIGCDLCDVIGTRDDPNLQGARIAVGAQYQQQEPTLCAQCAAPLVEILQRLKDRNAQKRLDDRIAAALKDGKL